MSIKPEQLKYTRQNVWEQVNDSERQEILQFNEDYKQFLTTCKTERICVQEIIKIAAAQGFIFIEQSTGLKPGDKVMINNRGKALMLAVIGRQGLQNGVSLIGSHADAPRLDLKPQPLFEESGMAYFKTHYYGGIKKYQWLARPLALYGIVCLQNGQVVNISIGDRPGDPVFNINDLLPHLAKDQMERKLSEAVEGEQLNINIGGIPLKDGEKDNCVKLAILNLLYQNYGIIEEDLISAELEVVPAGPAYDVGLDRSMVGAYGQDDRVSVYTSLRAILETVNPQRTAVALFADKEEIGSTGNTGMNGSFLPDAISEIGAMLDPKFNGITLRRVMGKSIALSADVTVGLDPNFEGVLEKNNAAHIGCGVVLTKYTGARGKNSTNDANAEFVALVRSLFNKNKVVWQTGELGKVDKGGGGTIAHMIAELGFEVIDCGVALLSMHSPFEIASKADVFEAYRGYKAFFSL